MDVETARRYIARASFSEQKGFTYLGCRNPRFCMTGDIPDVISYDSFGEDGLSMMLYDRYWN